MPWGFAPLQLLNQVMQLIVLDERSRFGGREPSRRPLLRLWPVLQLPFHQQRKDLNLTQNGNDPVFQPLRVNVVAERAPRDVAANTSLLVSLSRRRLGRLQTLYGPAFRDDPSLCFAGGDKQHFNRSLIVKAVRQRPILNPNRRVRLRSLLRRFCFALLRQGDSGLRDCDEPALKRWAGMIGCEKPSAS
jgi:hypothetical protein